MLHPLKTFSFIVNLTYLTFKLFRIIAANLSTGLHPEQWKHQGFLLL